VEQESDGALVAQVLAGNAAPYTILVRRYQEPLFRYARGMAGDGDAAADLVQDAFIKAYRNLDGCQNPDRFGAWVFRILVNGCKDHLRSPRRRRESLSDDMPATASEFDPVLTLDQSELRAKIGAALGALPFAQRQAFLLKHVEGHSYEEMAELVGVSVPALKMRVLRAREALQESLTGLV
jgi:RNA polymerase sigma-70 factor (ECF subfamily)